MYRESDMHPLKLAFYGSLSIGLVLFCVIWLLNNVPRMEETETNKIDIAGFERESDVEGTFHRGNGTLENEEYYVVYTVQKDGSKDLLKLPADTCVIYDNLTQDSNPYVELTSYTLGGAVKSSTVYLPENYLMKYYNFESENAS